MAKLDEFEAGRLRRIVVRVEKNDGEEVEAFEVHSKLTKNSLRKG